MPRSRTFKAAILGSGNILVKMTSLVALAVLSRIFTKTEYGAYRQTLDAYFIIAPALMLGLPQALYYFIPRDKEHGRRLVTSNLFLLGFTGAVFTIAIWCGGNRFLAKAWSNPALERLLLIFSPYALLALPVVSIAACLAACNRIKQLAVFNVTSRIVSFAAVIALVWVRPTPAAAVTGQVIGAAIVFFPALFLMYHATSGTQWLATPGQMWEQIKYSIPLGLSSMLGLLSRNLDKLIVSSMCSPEAYAVYRNGAVELPVIATITSSVMAVLLPEFARMFKEDRPGQIVPLWNRAMVKCSLIIFPLMAFLMTMAREAMVVLFSKDYQASSIPFRIYLLLLPLRITTFGPIVMASGRSHMILICTAISLALNLVLSIVLTYTIGYTGAAIATVVVGYTFGFPFFLILISKLCQCPVSQLLPYKQLGAVGVVSAVAAGTCALVAVLVPIQSDWIRLAIGAAVFGSVYFVGVRVANLIPRQSLRASIQGLFNRGSS